jgi:hypothetical protein
VARPQALGHEINNLGLTAMGIDDDQLVNARTHQCSANFGPGGEKGFSFMAQGAREGTMFCTFADCLSRQDQNGRVGFKSCTSARDEAIGDHHVGAKRKVWAVLLDRANWKHGNAVLARQRSKIV